MAVAMYYTWVQQGKPLEPAKPVREIVERMKAAFPGAGPFSWFANDAHYQSNTPGDHTPFSRDGYAIKPSPYPIIFATDIMHQPQQGVDCFKLFPYWLAEAKAGRMPWLKYLIWQAKIYDVRHAWVAQANSDHFDHIHISTRTDYQNASLGTWSLLPGGEDMTLPPDYGLDRAQTSNSEHYLQSLVNMTPNATGISNTVQTDIVIANKLVSTLQNIQAMVTALSKPVPLPVDLEAVRAIVREEIDKSHLAS
jgi:hypothetical protein